MGLVMKKIQKPLGKNETIERKRMNSHRTSPQAPFPLTTAYRME